MKLQKINERIHRGFRAWLFELHVITGQTDFLQIEQGRKTVDRLQSMIRALEHKFEIESQQIFPVLALKAPYSVYALDEEKRIVESKCRQVARIIEQYTQPGLPVHYASTGKALQEAFSNLAEFLLRYMKLEDQLLSAAMAENAASENSRYLVDVIFLQTERQLSANPKQDLLRVSDYALLNTERASIPGMNERDFTAPQYADNRFAMPALMGARFGLNFDQSLA